MSEETLTAAEIAQNYSAALDSVTLINALMDLSSRTEEETATVSRNVEHLQIMVAKTYWTSEDLDPLNDAVTRGGAA
ncbi:MAG: hypothetical protein CL855_00515 [Cryomorphaceae bacterium]|nr:hypothetical protein [Cryomorphaceae bacterium]